MRKPYKFAVLRYIHDPIVQEFANVGVVLFSPEMQYLDAACVSNYGRLTKMFVKVDGARFRELTRHVQTQIQATGEELRRGHEFVSGLSFDAVLARIIPPDDMSFAFTAAGVGFSEDFDKTLRELYSRFVLKYAGVNEIQRRTDDDIWRVYRKHFEHRHVTKNFVSKRIAATDFEYNFHHSWRNETWHLYEPMSFDMTNEDDILNKANKWLGRATVLQSSPDSWKMHVLLGEPRDSKLESAYVKAENILNKMTAPHEFISEGEAEQFAESVAQEMASHT